MPLKAKASTRTIPVDDLLLQEITAHMQKYPPGDGTVQVLISNREGRVPQRNTSVRRGAAPSMRPGCRRAPGSMIFGILRKRAYRREPESEGHSGEDGALQHRRDDGHLRAPFPDSDELGRGAFDTLFADPDVHGKCTGETGS